MFGDELSDLSADDDDDNENENESEKNDNDRDEDNDAESFGNDGSEPRDRTKSFNVCSKLSKIL